MRTLLGKVAVVTGAGSGIGRALARELVDRGARVAMLDRDEGGLTDSVGSLQGADVRGFRVDVSDANDVQRAAAAVLEHFGQVDVLVNNAGIAHGGRPFWELPEVDFSRVVDVNFWGVVHGTRAFLPHLIARPEAVVVNVSSLFGLIGVTGQSGYCASKFAVRGFTESLRMELREHAPQVRAITVHPGGVKTAIARSSLPAGQSADAHQAEVQAFDALARTTAEDAAKTIAAAIVSGRVRVLIGIDAKVLDVLARTLPQRYTGLLLRQLRKGVKVVPQTPSPTESTTDVAS